MMTALNYLLAIEKQTIKLPREYRLKQELIHKPVLGVMSVEPSTSVKSGINFDNDFIDTSTSIDEQEFRTHHKEHLESDIQVSVKDEEMEEESIDTPLKCTICKKLFVQMQDFKNHVWAHTEEKICPMNYEECGFEYKSLPQHSYLGRDQEIREKKPRISRIAALFGATLNEAMEEKSETD